MAKVKVKSSVRTTSIGANVPVNGKPIPQRGSIGANIVVKK